MGDLSLQNHQSGRINAFKKTAGQRGNPPKGNFVVGTARSQSQEKISLENIKAKISFNYLE